MSIASFTKDPEAVLDYQIGWSDWLIDDDVIIDSTWVADNGITIETSIYTDTNATVWLSGGADRTGYEVTNQITTAGGRVDERTIRIKCKNL